MDYHYMTETEANQRANDLWKLADEAPQDDCIVIDETLVDVFVNAAMSWFPPQNIIPAFRVPHGSVLLCIYKGKKVVLPIANN